MQSKGPSDGESVPSNTFFIYLLFTTDNFYYKFNKYLLLS